MNGGNPSCGTGLGAVGVKLDGVALDGNLRHGKQCSAVPAQGSSTLACWEKVSPRECAACWTGKENIPGAVCLLFSLVLLLIVGEGQCDLKHNFAVWQPGGL